MIETHIAWRYLRAKKSHNAINIISGIAVGGITIATIAMVVVLSVFNGFQDLLKGLYTEFDPVLKVVPAEGKYFSEEQCDSLCARIGGMAEVEAVCRVVEDEALILFRGHPEVITVKGVDDNFTRVSSIRSICYGEGHYQLHRADVEYVIPGVGLGQMMGGPNFSSFQVCAPRGGERINVMDPFESLSVVEVENTGLVFSVNQRKYDERYLLSSLSLAQTLFEKEGECTALELALRPGAKIKDVKAAIKAQQGGGVALRVLDRMEQQESVFGIMEIEKLLAYVFLTFILVVACFNIISSVSMLIIEKQHDALTLSHLGMTLGSIRRIFVLEGQMITLIGTTAGIVIGTGLCLAQEYFGLIKLGTGENFIVQDYPVSVHLLDILAVLLTALVIGFLATIYPIIHLIKHDRK